MEKCKQQMELQHLLEIFLAALRGKRLKLQTLTLQQEKDIL